MVEDKRAFTRDFLFDRELAVCQEKGGYRFSVDAVLLAGLTEIKRDDRVIELGTGCGVVPLVLAHRQKTRHRIVGLEIQSEMARLARQNVDDNGLGDQVEILEMDLRLAADRFGPGSFDIVLGNPPYRKAGTGRMNPDRRKAIARHEVASTLPDVFAAADHLLPPGGRIALIYPATRIGHLFHSALDRRFSPKRLTIIHSRPGGPGRLVHLECRKLGGEEARIEPPFFIYGEDGKYSAEMNRLYRV